MNSDELYFTDTDYNTFTCDKQNLNTKVIRDDRKLVQDKLLELNKDILKEIRKYKLELYNHANPKNTTSLIFPCWYNKGKVDWIGIRYGKHPKDIRELNKTMEPAKDRQDDIKMNFQKHACIQVNIGYSGLDVGIFHAVPSGAIDRWYLHEHIEKNDENVINKIIGELKKIRGYGYKWHIFNTNIDELDVAEKVFDFDTDDINTFIDWYQENDKDGCYSSMLVHYPRYSKDIVVDNIVSTCVDIIKQVYPIYKSMIWNIHK